VTSPTPARPATFLYLTGTRLPGDPCRRASYTWRAVRILVKLKQPGCDPQAIASRASEVAGLPVGYIAAASEAWHALVIACDDAAACREALARLQADAVTYDRVSPDMRRRVDNP